MTTRTHITTIGDVTMTRCDYESGLVEIGFRTPELLPGAGPILRSVAWRQERGMPWRSSLAGESYRGMRHRTMKLAVKRALDGAQLAHNRAKADLAACREQAESVA